MSLLSIKAAVGKRVRALRSAAGGAAIVLTYHRVADLAADPQLLAIPPDVFEAQIRALARVYELLSARELFSLMAERRRFPQRAVVITLDDGYADALTHAKPILADIGAPATVFVSSDCLEDTTEFWWDQVERAILLPDELPAHLELTAGAARFTREVDAATRSQRIDAGWNIASPECPARQRLYLDACEFLRPLGADDRQSALASLREQTGTPAEARPTHRTLDADGLHALSAGDTIEIGAHTRSHQALALHTEAEQRDEILGSKELLEAVLDHPVTSLSYPHGGRETYSPATERIAAEAGFSGACANHFGIVLPRADRFAVPRCPTENVDAATFLARVEGWFDAGR